MGGKYRDSISFLSKGEGDEKDEKSETHVVERRPIGLEKNSSSFGCFGNEPNEGK